MKKTIFTLLMSSYAINFAFAETDSNIMLIAAQMALAESTIPTEIKNWYIST